MTTKTNRIIDPQGRIIIPNHLRKALNLNPGNVVEVRLADDGTIRIKPCQERCAVCGESVDGKPFAKLSEGANRKLICYQCAQKIAQAMIKQM